jgi:hypothetical protein
VAWDVLLLPDSGPVTGGAPFIAINLGFGLALGRWSAVGLATVIFLLALPFLDETYGEGGSIVGLVVLTTVGGAVLLAAGVLARRLVERVLVRSRVGES